ncbi:MAG: ABC transporter permease [Anaerolineaceae bacterium]|nr:MAG: ABC transporter permease [Anaerolineaceae bacterium]
MILKILRPQYWILDRQVRNTNRLVVIALITLPMFGVQWLYNNLIRDNLALLRSDQAVTAIASYLPLGLFFFLLFAMLGIGDVMHQLYLASDLELLMIAPVRFRIIFIVKLLQSSRATLIPALGLGAFLFALGWAWNASASYYLLSVLLILAAMTQVTAMIMIFVILLARLLPTQKIRSWLPVLVVLTTFTLILGQQPATEWFLDQVGLITRLAEGLLDPQQLSRVVAGFGALALLTSVVASQTFNLAFHEGWNRLREVPIQQVSTSPVTRRSWGASQLVRPLPKPLRHFLVKEWLELRRNPRGLINLAQPLILVVAMVILPALRSGSERDTLQPLLFGFMMMMLALFIGILPIGTSLMAVAQEGRRMALLRSAPISMSEVIKGKFWATWAPIALSWTVVLIIAGIWLQFPMRQIGFLVGMTILGLAGASIMTVVIGGLSVDFTAEELKQRISVGVSYLLMGINSIYMLLTVVTVVWLMIRLLPDSRFVLAIHVFANSGTIGWLFSDSLWIPIALAGGQVLFGMAIKVVWDAAVRRLEAWEGI